MPVRDATKPGQDLAWWWNVVQWTVTRRVVSTRDRGDTEIPVYFLLSSISQQFPQFATSLIFVSFAFWYGTVLLYIFVAQHSWNILIVLRCREWWYASLPHFQLYHGFTSAGSSILCFTSGRNSSTFDLQYRKCSSFFRELRFFQSRVWKSSKSFWGVAEGSSPLITGYHGLRECWFFNFLRTDRSLADWTQLMSTTNYRADDVESEYVARGLCMFTWGCFASYHLHNGAMSEKADGFLEKPQPGFFSWIGPAFKSRRTMKTWFRCCVALTATLVLMVDKKTSLNMGQASFFAAYVFWISNFTRLTGR